MLVFVKFLLSVNRRLDPDGCPQLGAGAPWIFLDFFLAGYDGLVCQNLHRAHFAAAADGKIRRADAGEFLVVEELLDNSVLQRMERDDCQKPPRGEQRHGCLKSLLERVKLVVDRNPQGLETAGCRR